MSDPEGSRGFAAFVVRTSAFILGNLWHSLQT
jgi:hypothetical protein